MAEADAMKVAEEARAAVLDLQKLISDVGPVAVRSCTSCLADSCNKPIGAPADPQ
jgi:hypothetical protein